eukprot:1784724-Amphidinium_carterae.1
MPHPTMCQQQKWCRTVLVGKASTQHGSTKVDWRCHLVDSCRLGAGRCPLVLGLAKLEVSPSEAHSKEHACSDAVAEVVAIALAVAATAMIHACGVSPARCVPLRCAKCGISSYSRKVLSCS